ncbi:hypothetical protein [Cupriavidus pinatubonensis]|nr:hypothetical protein [Cupriavidus pinatubonensis]
MTLDEPSQIDALLGEADEGVRELAKKLRIPRRFACFFNRKFVVWKATRGGVAEVLAVPSVTDVDASLEMGFRIRLKDLVNGVDQWAVHTPQQLGQFPLLVWVPHEQKLVWRQKEKNGRLDHDLVCSLVARLPSDPTKFLNPGKVYMVELNIFKELYPSYHNVDL